MTTISDAYNRKTTKFENLANKEIVEARLATLGLTRDDVTEVLTVNYHGKDPSKFTCYIFTDVNYEQNGFNIQIPSPLMESNLPRSQYYGSAQGIGPTAEALGLPILTITNDYHEGLIAFNPDKYDILGHQFETMRGRPITTLVDKTTGDQCDVYGTVQEIMEILGKTETIAAMPEYKGRKGYRTIQNPQDVPGNDIG